MPLKKDLTSFDLTSIVVGSIIGADIYIASALTAGLLGPAAILVWIVAGYVQQLLPWSLRIVVIMFHVLVARLLCLWSIWWFLWISHWLEHLDCWDSIASCVRNRIRTILQYFVVLDFYNKSSSKGFSYSHWHTSISGV